MIDITPNKQELLYNYKNQLIHLFCEFARSEPHFDYERMFTISVEVSDKLKTLRMLFKKSNVKIFNMMGLDLNRSAKRCVYSFKGEYNMQWFSANPNGTEPKTMYIRTPEEIASTSPRRKRRLEKQKTKEFQAARLDKITHQVLGFLSNSSKAVENVEKVSSEFREVFVDEEDGINGAEKLKNVIHVIHDIMDKSAKQAGPNGTLDDLSDKIVESISTLYANTSDTVSTLGLLSSNLDTILQILVRGGVYLLIFVCGYNFITYGSKFYAALGAILASYLAYKSGAVSKLLSFFLGKINHQGALETAGVFIAGLLSVMHVTYDKNTLGSLVSYITTAERRAGNVTDMLIFIKQFFVKVSNMFLKTCGFEQLYSFPTGENFQADTIFQTWESIQKRMDKNNYPYCEATYAEIASLTAKCQEFIKTNRETQSNKLIVREVNSIYSKAHVVRAKMAQSNWSDGGYRAEPVCLVLVGEPGVGKTSSVEHIASYFCAKVLPEADQKIMMDKGSAEDYTYVRQDENEYWEGYSSKHVVAVYDDFGQRRSVIGSSDCYFEMIRAVNSFVYLTHMAAIEAKSNSYFKSRLIIVTSNKHVFQSDNLVDQKALNRRMRFKFRVHVKPEYRNPDNGEIDWSKIPGIDGSKVCDPEVVNYYVPIDDNGNPTNYNGKGTFSFFELMEAMMLEYNIKENIRASKSEFMRQRIVNLCKKSEPAHPVQMDVVHQGFLSGTNNFFSSSFNDWLDLKLKDVIQSIKCHASSCSRCSAGLLIKAMSQGQDSTLLTVCSSILSADGSLPHWTEAWSCANYDYLYRKIDSLTYTQAAQCVGNLRQMYTADISGEEYNVIENKSNFELVLLYLKAKCESLYYVWQSLKMFLVQEHMGITSTFLTSIGLDAFLLATGAFVSYGTYKVFTKGAEWFGSNAIAKDVPFEEIEATQVEYYDSALPQSGKMRKTGTGKVKGIKNLVARYQVGSQNAFEIMEAVARKNLYHFTIVPNLDGSNLSDFRTAGLLQCGYALFLKGTTFVIPAHFWLECAVLLQSDSKYENYTVNLTSVISKNRNSICFTMEDFMKMVQLPDIEDENGNDVMHSDIAFCKAPKWVTPHKDISKYFVTTKEAESVNIKNVALQIFCHPSGSMTERFLNSKVSKMVVTNTDGFDVEKSQIMGGPAMSLSKRPVVIRSNDVVNVLEKGHAYRIPTKSGDCGTTVTCTDAGAMNGKILGIHVAGSPSAEMGFSQLLTQELIEKMCSEEVSEPLVHTRVPDTIVAQGQFLNSHTVDKGQKEFGTSKIRPSLLHPIYGPSYGEPKEAPAQLKPFIDNEGTKIDPFDIGLSGYCTSNVGDYCKGSLNFAVQSVATFLSSVGSEEIPLRTLSFEEAVLGIEGCAHFKSLTRSTSAGYPYNVLNVKKKDIFGSDDAYNLSTPLAIELKEQVYASIEKARRLIREEHIFCDNLKDETRPLSKIALGKTRVFCAAPLKYTILVRMFFGDFMRMIQKYNVIMGMAIGLNPYGDGWHHMTKRLLALGDNPQSLAYGAGDFKCYDGSEKPFIHWEILDIIEGFYRGPDSVVRRVLWYDLVNSKHLKGDLVYEWTASLPSGHPLTAVVNSLYNHVAMNYCYVRLCIREEREITSFYNNVYLIVMGDDNLFSVSREARFFFTENNLADVMSELGLTYTSDDKTEVKIGLRDLYNVSFLKRSFRLEKEAPIQGLLMKWVAPLQLDAILEPPFWVRKSIMPSEDITSTNVDNSLKELSLHGRSVFERYGFPMIDAYNRSSIHPKELHFTNYVTARFAVGQGEYIF